MGCGERLQHVDGLGDTGHAHPVDIFVEDVERRGGDQCSARSKSASR